MRGSLYGIGVGPGEPELITLKALKYIQKADAVILPAEPKEECHAYRSVHEVYPNIDKKEILCLPFLMSKDKKELEASHNRIYHMISSMLEQGRNVAFLTIGDPCIYSTYSYIHTKEIENNGDPVIISGVPSFCAAAAALSISLADQKEEIHIIPASYEIEDSLKLKGTKIYMKSGKSLKRLKQFLQEASEKENILIYSAADCGLATEKLAAGAEHIDAEGGYLTVVIVKNR